MLPYLVRRLFDRVIGSRREFRVYAHDPSQGFGANEEGIAVYDAGHPPTETVLRALSRNAGRLGTQIMLRRMRRHGGFLLTLMKDSSLHGFGWIQTWKPVEREFWWLADDGVCLGPYWTHPEMRGRGIYGRLLSRSLFECQQRGWSRLFIWSRAENEASIRGIEKAGFHSLGTHRVSVFMFGLIRRHDELKTANSK